MMDALSTRNLERRAELKINDWIARVRGKVVGQKRRDVYDSIPVEWINPDSEMGRSIHDWQAQITTEEVLVVEIPVKELTTMSETMEWYERNIGGYQMDEFDKIIRAGYFEKDLREKHPGLQEAWEQYQIMLSLCSDKSYHK
jgi:hypothetical protein